MSPKHFREPIIDGGIEAYDGYRHECIVEVSQNKIGVVEINISPTGSQRNAGDATDQELCDEGESK